MENLDNLNLEKEEIKTDCGCGSGGKKELPKKVEQKNDMPLYLKEIFDTLKPEIAKRYDAYSSPIPPAVSGCTVLILGSGTGKDAYIISKLVGENGRVIAVDPKKANIEFAKKWSNEMAKTFGYENSNIEFVHGSIDDLKILEIDDASVDVVISNPIINTFEDKEKIFSEIWRVLKTGGELYFTNIFSDRRIPKDISSDYYLKRKYLGGAMYIEDFRRLLRKIGWEDFRYTNSNKILIDDEKTKNLTGNISFSLRTVRAIKLPELIEDICEQYGQFAIYRGGIPGFENYFDLDANHRFFKDLPMSVCGNSCAMVQNTRFKKYFEIIGDRTTHFGAFEGC